MVLSTQDTAAATTSGETPRKHCWECLRRRLVCDSVRPVCNRCRSSGLVCPGYEETQPLRWVKPGRVTARVRRRRQPKASTQANQNQNQKQKEQIKTNKSKKSQDEAELDADVIEANIEDRTSDSSDDELRSKFGALSVLGIVQPETLDAIMRYDISCENFAGVQESYIYNCEVYERSSPLTLLLREEERFKLPLAKIAQYLPAPIKGLFILFTLGHQMHRLPHDAEENVRVKAQSALAFWTYQVVRTLNEDIAREGTQVGDGTITAVLMLMMADQQMHPSGRWRFHHKGLMQMLRLRGGVEKVWNERPHMHSGILTMIIGEVFANTTSPSHDQLVELTHPKNLDFLRSAWGDSVQDVYVGSICPPSLFSDVIRINHLRALATQGISYTSSSSSSSSSHSSSSAPSPSSCSEEDMPVYTDAQTLLDRILAFSPEIYAATHGKLQTESKWLLVARVHQSAAALYCMLSLQSILLLPETEAIARATRLHYDRLLLDLKEGFEHPALRNCFFWALVIVGAAAVHGTAFERAFVADLLRDSAPHMGSSMPILARKVLMDFWASGKKGWDDCFDLPYIFLM
ncbi:hypothetical protein F5X98DRAFT_336721 [Xylaria grammica]|nr:hypothetical protein F5X98DRAFT_336721 [Xylaria grammica]